MPALDEMCSKIIGGLRRGVQPSPGVLVSLKEAVDAAVELEVLPSDTPLIARQIVSGPGGKKTVYIQRLTSTDGGTTFSY